uniref:Mon2/Sec7/BIG1-like HDS domain-containing protein n=1 Tax=Acrobeloides nanus TaxID=290746 RepID=A0A914C014_9BILA
MLNSYCINRYSKTLSGSQEEIAVFMDMTALLTELLTRIDSGNGSPEEIQLALDAIYSVLSVQPSNFHRHQPFWNFFNSELIPSMLCLIQTSGETAAPKTSILHRSLHRKESKKPQRINIFAVADSPRSFYQVCEQVIRLLAQVPDAQDVWVEFLRTILLTPPATKRTETLKLLKRLLTNQHRLTELLELMASDSSVWPILIECIEECAKCENEVAVEAVRSINSLLESINMLIERPEVLEEFSDLFYTKICEKNANIEAEEENRITEAIHKASSGSSHLPKTSSIDEESKSVDNFLEKLRKELPRWIELTTKNHVDQNIQQFAARIVHENATADENNTSESQFLNCDAIYLTTYSVLSFCLRFRESTISKEWLLEQVKGAGCMAYVDTKWLAVVQARVLNENILDEVQIPLHCALIDLIEDYDGYNKRLLSKDVRKEEPSNSTDIKDETDNSTDMKTIAFQTWSKRLIRSCWRTITEILTRFPLKVSKKSSHEKTIVDGTEASLESMRTLCTTLLNFKLDKEVLWLYEKLGEHVTDLEELREFIVKNADSKKVFPMTRLDALGMDLLLDNAIQCGTLSNACWKYVVRGIQYATELERYLFRITKNSNTGYDVAEKGLRELLENFGQNELPVPIVGKILDELMLKIDCLLDTAVKTLNLNSICSFLAIMVSSNEDILKYSDSQIDRALESCNIIQRISRLVVGSSTRPLVHRMKIWCTTKEHFVELTREKFPEEVSKRAISSLHDCIKALLQKETPGFCFNQILFNAFQNVLCVEVCKPETQEHVVAILSTFIQECPEMIGSGWKPLLGAVKAVRISTEIVEGEPKISHTNQAVLHFFKSYIELEKPEILMATLPEFFQCLINYLQTQDSNLEDQEVCETAFAFVLQIQGILLKYFEEDVPAQEHLIKRIREREKAHLFVEEAYMQKVEHSFMPLLAKTLVEAPQFGVFPSQLDNTSKKPFPYFPWHNMNDRQMAICELILNMVEQLSSLVVTCIPQLHQKLLFDLSQFVSTIKTTALGMPFGVYSLCTIILPTLQKWVQREKYGFLSSIEVKNTSIRNLKQATGAFTELIADYIKEFSGKAF